MESAASSGRRVKVNLLFLTEIILGEGSSSGKKSSKTSKSKKKEQFRFNYLLKSSIISRNSSHFDALYRPEGFHSAKKWFLSNAGKRNETFDTFSENQFIDFLRKLTDFKDYEILELFDILGTHFY